MKKLKFLLLLLLAGSMTFVSCTKDDDKKDDGGGDNPPAKKEMKLVKVINEDNSSLELQYNSDNNLTKRIFKDKDGNLLPYYEEFTYTNGDMTMYTVYNNGAAAQQLTVTYVDGKPSAGNYQTDQGSGLVDYFKLAYTYGGEDLATLDYIVGGNTVQQVTYTYTGSNVTKTSTVAGGSLAGEETFTYDEKKNPMNGVGINYTLGDASMASVNNQLTNTKTDAADVVVDAQSYVNTFEYNDNDYPTKITANALDNQTTTISVLEYEEK